MSKLIYIAGPYRSDSEIGVLGNIQAAEKIAARVWSLGLYALCPHKNSAFFGGITSDENFLQGGLEMLRRCDAVMVVSLKSYDGFVSSGTALEIAEARKLNIPIFHRLVDLGVWLDGGFVC